MQLIYFQERPSGSGFESFQESMLDKNLTRFASDLVTTGLLTVEELPVAIDRAMKICKSAGMDVRAHFKAMNVCKDGHVFVDWRISPLAGKLILLNGNPSNPVVAKLQLELVSQSRR